MSTVSVVITTYFRNDQLQRAIESVIHQPNVDADIYVIDMSGRETARPVAEEYGVRYVPIRSFSVDNALEQVAIARDIGASISDGDYLYFLDDDNVVVNGGLSRLVEALEDDVGVACCIMDGLLTPQQIYPFFASDEVVDPEAVLEFTLMNLVAPFSLSGMLIERDTLEAIPPMRELPHDDIAVVIELAAVTGFSTVGEKLVEMQGYHGLSLTEDSIEGRIALFEHYAEVYDHLPDTIEQYGQSRKHFLLAKLELLDRRWSPRMIYHYGKYAYHYPDATKVQYLTAVASLFGRSGVQTLWSRMDSMDATGGW
ncbi:Glycosyl transferase family 2 [Natronorubrum texcoconense]|uniref:Glycosyl transferase family 2 n=2 Tax=Natronorubrum texcoconense TaxID=1095776 RepID=A0A1G8WRW3_9EURY|nr:glycosyltransferase family 2 protein [Natronorubrum texcoconense]SDJ80941.1 Glycosyl transferase family 2 [Natronorubrum texcoconense]